jgi:hypothetical protein
VDLKIEKGIPIPGRRNGFSETLRKMKPGDSVLLPRDRLNANALAHDVLGSGNYATRKEDGGTRVWRTK